MRGTHVAAAFAFILTAQCLPIPQPAAAREMRETQKQEKPTPCGHMAPGE